MAYYKILFYYLLWKICMHSLDVVFSNNNGEQFSKLESGLKIKNYISFDSSWQAEYKGTICILKECL